LYELYRFPVVTLKPNILVVAILKLKDEIPKNIRPVAFVYLPSLSMLEKKALAIDESFVNLIFPIRKRSLEVTSAAVLSQKMMLYEM